MKNIYQNPYRIIGIVSNATIREIQARKGKIQAFTRIGKPIDSEYDFRFLESISRNEANITKAFSDIEQNIDKVKHALFWFINHSSFDQMALEHLKNGDEAKAREIWHKLTNEQEINARNFSAYSNIATLWLLSEEEMPKVSGIQYKIKLIESDYFTDFVHLVADETYNIDKNKQIEIFIDELLKENIGLSQVPLLLKELGGYAKTYLTQKATEEPIYNIETAVESCEEKRRKDKSNTYRFAKELYTNTQKPLIELKNILGIQDLKYQTMADSIAKELKQCAIDNWNNSNEEVTDLKKSIELTILAYKIAIGKNLKEDIKKDVKTLEELKDRELNKAIEVLEMIEKAYYNVPFGSSLNWDKVTDLITELISRNDIEKIKNSKNTQKLNEYRHLVDFIIDKIDYSFQKKKIAYICYWKMIIIPEVPTRTYTPTSIGTANSSPSSSTAPRNSNDDDNDGCVFIILRILGVFVILYILVNMCSSNEDSNYSDSSYQTEQEITPKMEEEEESDNDIRSTYETSSYYSEEEEEEEEKEEENFFEQEEEEPIEESVYEVIDSTAYNY